jgi:hypothetical protein
LEIGWSHVLLADHLSRSFHKCSTGFMFDDMAGHGMVWMLLSARNWVVSCAT